MSPHKYGELNSEFENKYSTHHGAKWPGPNACHVHMNKNKLDSAQQDVAGTHSPTYSYALSLGTLPPEGVTIPDFLFSLGEDKDETVLCTKLPSAQFTLLGCH